MDSDDIESFNLPQFIRMEDELSIIDVDLPSMRESLNAYLRRIEQANARANKARAEREEAYR